MKNLLLILLTLLTTLTLAQQDKEKKDLTQQEKDLLGKWSFKNEFHMMKDQIPESKNVFTVELKADYTFNSSDVYTKKGIELLTSTEPGTWEIADGKITFKYSGKSAMSRNGVKITNSVIDKVYSGKESKQEELKAKKIKEASVHPRSVTFYYKIDKGDLLFTTKKGEFKNASVFKKN